MVWGRLVLLDFSGTLAYVRHGVAHQYAKAISERFQTEVDEKVIAEAFKRAYKEQWQRQPNFGGEKVAAQRRWVRVGKEGRGDDRKEGRVLV